MPFNLLFHAKFMLSQTIITYYYDCLKVFVYVFMMWPCGTTSLQAPLINLGQHM